MLLLIVLTGAVFPPLFLVMGESVNATCDCSCSMFQPTTTCSVQRLTFRNDCPCCKTCLRQAGELCDSVAFPCDHEFGLTCSEKTDRCEGPFGLRTLSVSHNILQVTWQRTVESQGQLYIFYTPNYSSDLRRWIMQETAVEGIARIQGLQAATDYYVALVPEWDGMYFFDNRSEVLVARTEGCLNKNQSYAVGEAFSDGCAYNCTCTPEGLLACIERKCPLVYKKGEIRDPLCKEHDDPASEDPCCVIYTCQNGHRSTSSGSNEERCVYKGREYQLGSEFYGDNCSSMCYCDEIGVVDCRPLKCPQPLPPLNSSLSCLEWAVKQPNVLSPPNCCPNITCINDGACEINGRRYATGTVIPTTCDQRCICDSGKVICESTCPEVPSSPPVDLSCPNFVLAKDLGGCCTEWKCVVSTIDACIIDGKMYYVGEKWTDEKNCRPRNCTCWKNPAGVTEEQCIGGCPVISAESLLPLPNCFQPEIVTPIDPCACPVVKCSEMRADASNLQENHLYFLQVTLLNNTSVRLVLNISDTLLTDAPAVLETHVAQRNDSHPETWHISETRLQRIQPVVVELITGFQDNKAYRIKSRLVLTDPNTNSQVALPFTETLQLEIPAKGQLCIVDGNVSYKEGAVVPQGCGQECLCQNGEVVCRPTPCAVQNTVLLASEFCPTTVLVKSADDCCPHWECHPSATDCKLGNAIYNHGDQWRNGCAEECSCRNGVTTCRDICQEQQRNSPHPSCTAVTVLGSCCPVWSCHEDVAAPVLDFAQDTENSAMNLTVDSITNTKARLTWKKPAELRSFFGFNLFIEESLVDRESYREAKLIHPQTEEYNLHDLAPGTRYTATLKAIEDGDRVVSSQTIQFQTLDTAEVMISVWLIYIGVDKAEAVWDCQRCDTLKSLKLNLLSMTNPGPAIGDVTPGLPKITLTALNAKENYQLWLDGITVNGAAVKSNILAFTTRSLTDFNEIPKDFQNATSSRALSTSVENEEKLSLALIIVSSLCGFFFLSFLLALGLCLRYNRSLTLQKNNSYHTYKDNMYK